MDGKAIRSSLVSLMALTLFTMFAFPRFSSPFPPLAASLSTSVTHLRDFIGIALGFRRLTADLAWIQTLIYYGTRLGAESDENGHVHAHEDSPDAYPLFLSYCERVIRIDPYFKYVYYYGSGVLGWNLNRIHEAEILLRQGIQANPREWRLQQYLAALAYQKDHGAEKLALFLESFITDPECPNLLRSILANIYKKQKRYKDAIRVWFLVYESGDPDYHAHAEASIRELHAILESSNKR